jgi:UPF0755 protein
MRRLLFIFIAALVFYALWFLVFQPVNVTDNKPVIVKIESGETVKTIAEDLYSKNLIRSPFVFRQIAKFGGMAGDLKAGAFMIRPSESVFEILKILSEGKSQVISVTVPEGYTVADIDRLMANKGLGQPGDILDCAFRCDFSTFDFLPQKAAGDRSKGYGSRLEGYLFPETYFVTEAEYNPKFFIERMLGTFRKRIIDQYSAEIQGSKNKLSDLVTMASLVETESRQKDERPVVAGILWKRLSNRIPLGVDAVTRYVLDKWSEPLTAKDLEMDSPYNTRKHLGLPPSPIANPGESAFVAALKPTDSTYWYYLHDSKGVVHYAVTNDEHNRNRALYLR